MENGGVVCPDEEAYEGEFFNLIEKTVYSLLKDEDINALKGNARSFEVIQANMKYAQLWKSISESFVESERNHQ